MKPSHIHLAVRDLPAALAWFDRVWDLKPSFEIQQMAIFPFGATSLFIDASDRDSPATIGYETDSCDRDFARVVERGATPISAPEDKPYGVRAAYLKGPSEITLEIEQPFR